VAAATAGPTPHNQILFPNRLQFFDAPAHRVLAHLLTSFARSHNNEDARIRYHG
jgi:hypothetical protein